MRVDFGHAQPLEAFGVIFAVEDIPLFAAFEDFLLLRGDLRADFGVHLLFELQQRCENIDDFLADGVAVFDEIHVVAGNEKIDDAWERRTVFSRLRRMSAEN